MRWGKARGVGENKTEKIRNSERRGKRELVRERWGKVRRGWR